MTVKELKFLLNSCGDDSQEVILKSNSGIEWKIISEDVILAPLKYKNKPLMYLTVE